MPDLKRGVKDSVFGCLFSEAKYTLELYRALHPEDTRTSEENVKIVTLESVLAVRQYNDLGMLIGSALIVLVEAQSTFTKNVAFRLLLYLVESYKEYAAEHELDLYSTAAVQIPRPELYVIYTGEKAVPEKLRLSDLFASEGEDYLELTARVLTGDGTGSIVDQYVRFCKIADEQREIHGYTQKAIDEIIRVCREEGILVEFLSAREKEVRDIMFTLFNQEEVTARHEKAVARQAREEGKAEGKAEGRAEGKAEGKAEGRAEGRAEGKAEGRAEGAIIGTVSVYREELGLDDQTIIEKIASKFNLPRDKAKSYVLS